MKINQYFFLFALILIQIPLHGLDFNELKKSARFLTLERRSKVELDTLLSPSSINDNSLLHRAAKNNHLVTLKVLLDDNADKESRDIDGATPLMVALKNRSFAAAKYLIEQNAGIHISQNDGITPLMEAAAQKMPSVVKLLIQHNASVNAIDKYHYSALEFACMANPNATLADTQETVKILLQNGAVINSKHEESALGLASFAGNMPVVKLLLNHGASVNTPPNTQTPLMCACNGGNIEIAKLFIDKGAKVYPTYIDVLYFSQKMKAWDYVKKWCHKHRKPYMRYEWAQLFRRSLDDDDPIAQIQLNQNQSLIPQKVVEKKPVKNTKHQPLTYLNTAFIRKTNRKKNFRCFDSIVACKENIVK